MFVFDLIGFQQILYKRKNGNKKCDVKFTTYELTTCKEWGSITLVNFTYEKKMPFVYHFRTSPGS